MILFYLKFIPVALFYVASKSPFENMLVTCQDNDKISLNKFAWGNLDKNCHVSLPKICSREIQSCVYLLKSSTADRQVIVNAETKHLECKR